MSVKIATLVHSFVILTLQPTKVNKTTTVFIPQVGVYIFFLGGSNIGGGTFRKPPYFVPLKRKPLSFSS